MIMSLRFFNNLRGWYYKFFNRKCVKIKNKFFIEFGVENYEEANTRLLLENKIL